jgi:hypothetical protein
MNDPENFRAWLEEAIADTPYSLNGIALPGLEQLHLRDAQVAPLIALLAEIMLSTCTQVDAVPTTHASAA